jgi:hypothetical protein
VGGSEPPLSSAPHGGRENGRQLRDIEEVPMMAPAAIWLLDTGGIPAAGAASAEGMVTLGSILGVLVVVTVACLFAIGYRQWRTERAMAVGSASSPAHRRATRRDSRGGGTLATFPLPARAR